MKSVALHNLGCKVNSYEMDYMQQILQENGYSIVPFDEGADIYIINTCTVTNVADRKSRQMIHRARRLNPAAVVVAVGCFVQTGPEAINDAGIDLAVGNDRKKDLFLILDEFLIKREKEGKDSDKTLCGKTVIDIGAVSEYEPMGLRETAGHTRAYIKIQDGCNQFCSYCIIPYVRGRVRSRRPEEIIDEVAGLASKGYREAVLTGIHLSSYGLEWGEEERLPSLIERLHEIPQLERIRLGSLEPGIIDREFAARLAGWPKVCPHFHLSLQSGCDETLSRMNRRYTTAEYDEKLMILRRAYGPLEPAFTTDVMVGFPGETAAEFAATVRFLAQAAFFEIHVFKYSRREGTAAAKMPNQLAETVKRERSASLIELGGAMSRTYREGCLGREADIIIEEIREIDRDQYCLGHTKEYVMAAVKKTAADRYRVGGLAAGRITDFLTEEIMLLTT